MAMAMERSVAKAKRRTAAGESRIVLECASVRSEEPQVPMPVVRDMAAGLTLATFAARRIGRPLPL